MRLGQKQIPLWDLVKRHQSSGLRPAAYMSLGKMERREVPLTITFVGREKNGKKTGNCEVYSNRKF